MSDDFDEDGNCLDGEAARRAQEASRARARAEAAREAEERRLRNWRSDPVLSAARGSGRWRPGDGPFNGGGHHTGRCMKCGSTSLWDDNSSYGCNNCGAFWCF